MRGSSHFVIGAAAGAGVGLATPSDPLDIGMFALIGGICALIPDLDTNGLASNKLTVPKQFIQAPLQLVGLAILFIGIYRLGAAEEIAFQTLIFPIAGLLLTLLSKFITQKRMLALTGLGILLLGISLNLTIWIVLLGVYVIAASFLPHRSYTHSLLGVGFFAVILHFAEQALAIEGLFQVGLIGYCSHLIADMKLLPMNRRGVKLFAPVWRREF